MPICTMLAMMIAVALASALVVVAQTVPPFCTSDSIASPREDFPFDVPSQLKFCPGTSYPGSMDSLNIDDPRSWVFTPMGADTSGTYSVTDPLGLLEVCMLPDSPQSLVISMIQQSLEDTFGEATITFTSESGSTTFVISYAPGGFHIVAGDEFMVDPTDPNALNSLLPNVWNATGLDRTFEVKLCEQTAPGQLANATPFFSYQRDTAPGCQSSGQRPAVSYSIVVGSEAIANPRTYTLVLLWTPDVNCPRCECGDCPCVREVSNSVVIQVMETGGTTSPPTTSTSTPTTTTPTSGGPSFSTGEAVGTAIGGVTLLVIIVTLFVFLCYWCRKRKKKTDKVSGLESGHEMTAVVNGGSPGGVEGSSHERGDSTDYEPQRNESRIIAIVVDRLIQVKTDWLESFKSALATSHGAKLDTPSFTSTSLRRKLDDYLLNENCDCLYVLLKGSLEQHRQNGTTDPSHVPIERIVQESYLHPSNCEKLVLVQFGVTSQQSDLVLANGIRVVNFPDDAPSDTGSSCANHVFRSVRPMLMDKQALTQAQDRATRVTFSEQEEAILKQLRETTKQIIDQKDENAAVLRRVEKTTDETLHITRKMESERQQEHYSPSPAAITTED